MLALLPAAALWHAYTDHRQVAQSDVQTNVAGIVGPPCPALTRAGFERTLTLQGPIKYVFEFNGAQFGRYFGHADCSVAASKTGLGLGSYPVCQFTSPALLEVKTPRGEFYFQPPIGQKATVLTPDGQARCVMAAPAWDGR